MSSDSGLVRSAAELAAIGAELDGNTWRKGSDVWLPLYEAKMCGFYDHRAADVVENEAVLLRKGQPDALSDEAHSDPSRFAQPRYWVAASAIPESIQRAKWLCGFRNVTSPTNERSMIPTAIAMSGVGHSLPLLHAAYAGSTLATNGSIGIRVGLLRKAEAGWYQLHLLHRQTTADSSSCHARSTRSLVYV